MQLDFNLILLQLPVQKILMCTTCYRQLVAISTLHSPDLRDVLDNH